MVSDRDKSVIESMCKTGMDLETLKGCFPKFSEEDIEEIYLKENRTGRGDAPDIMISCNCS